MRLLLSFAVAFISLYFLNQSLSLSAIAKIPPRPKGAMSGHEFLRKTQGMSAEAREAAILKEIERGNVPSFLRTLKPVDLALKVDGKMRHATVFVMPDYLAIGSDTDYVRIPMTPLTAQKIADRFQLSLPTPKIVDAVNAQAKVKLNPSPLPAGRQMTSSEYYQKHNDMIERQRRGKTQGVIVAGVKKDVVLTDRLASRPHQVAIYGWHRKNGRPIQPLSLVHENTYADYSHGVRLVSQTVLIDGKEKPLASTLHDRKLAKLVSYEGTMHLTRIPGANIDQNPNQKKRYAQLVKSKPNRIKLAKKVNRRRSA